MAEIVVRATKVLRAPPDVVFTIFADDHDAHPSVPPRPHFGALVVEHGGMGAGTRFRVERGAPRLRAGPQGRLQHP